MLANQAKTQGITVEEPERRMAEQNSVHHIVDATAVPYPVGFLASPIHLHQRRRHRRRRVGGPGDPLLISSQLPCCSDDVRRAGQ